MLKTKFYYKSSNDAIRSEYNRLASEYDRRWSSYIRETTRETIKRLELRAADSLLDIGCGTGTLLQFISLEFPSVELTGLDFSPEMIFFAVKKLGKCAKLMVANGDGLPFPARTFDTVVSCNTFHYWRNPEYCLSEIARVLKPKGRLVITDWCDDYLACRICDFFLRIFNRAHFRTYGRVECERILCQAGFRNVEIQQYKINWLWGMMSAKAR